MTHHETMTSRERVIRTLNRQPVDRMPIDLGVHYSTGISAFAYHRLREHLGLSTDAIDVPDVVQFLARVDADILERFHCDCMLLAPPWLHTRRWSPQPGCEFTIPAAMQPTGNDDGDWLVERLRTDGTVGRMRMPSGANFFDGDWMGNWYECDGDALLAMHADQAQCIYNDTDYATIYMGFGAYFNGSDPDWLCTMITDPDDILEANRRQSDADLVHAGKILDALGPYVQAICINADMGIQTGPMCRPSDIERFSAPFIKRLCNFIHAHSDCKIFHHCCGSIRPIIPILIDAGVDILNPVQISAVDMDPADLKTEFGDRIIFWGGGCNTQHVLDSATPDQVAEHVRQTIATFKPGGGFVFNQVHNIMANVPPDNIVAMLDTAYANAFY